MTDKLVTHDDLPALRRIAAPYGPCPAGDTNKAEKAVLDRLIAAAEADAPLPPEGWYSWRTDNRGNIHVWHDGDGRVWLYDSCQELFGYAREHRDRLTSLRPTVAEAHVQALAEDGALWAPKSDETHAYRVRLLDDVLDALGIEVQS